MRNLHDKGVPLAAHFFIVYHLFAFSLLEMLPICSKVISFWQKEGEN